MTPQKALELVGEYGRLTRKIKSLTELIGESLEACHGIDGKRLEVDEWGCHKYTREVDRKGRDKSTHLWSWYNEPIDQHEDGEAIYECIDAGKAAVCIHCYEANTAVQMRRDARRRLGVVKGIMSRSFK